MYIDPWAAHFLGADLDVLLLLKMMLFCMTQILPCGASASHFAQRVIVHLQSCWMTCTHHSTFQGCDARHTDNCKPALVVPARLSGLMPTRAMDGPASGVIRTRILCQSTLHLKPCF